MLRKAQFSSVYKLSEEEILDKLGRGGVTTNLAIRLNIEHTKDNMQLLFSKLKSLEKKGLIRQNEKLKYARSIYWEPTL